VIYQANKKPPEGGFSFLKTARLTGWLEKFKILMEQLAIPLGHQTTLAKWLVISEARREGIFSAQHITYM
jgi:hypothetical protein